MADVTLQVRRDQSLFERFLAPTTAHPMIYSPVK